MTINKDELRRLAEKYMCQFGGSDEDFSDSILALLDELEAAQRDAERYRWLIGGTWYVGPEPEDTECGYISHDKNWTLNGVTEAVDAAMQEQKP